MSSLKLTTEQLLEIADALQALKDVERYFHSWLDDMAIDTLKSPILGKTEVDYVLTYKIEPLKIYLEKLSLELKTQSK